MKYPLALALLLATLVLVAAGWLQSAKASGVTLHPQASLQESVQYLFLALCCARRGEAGVFRQVTCSAP